MIKVTRSIELIASHDRSRTTVEGFVCPSCMGKGYKILEIGHDEYEDVACDKCQGSGRLKALIEVAFVADLREHSTDI